MNVVRMTSTTDAAHLSPLAGKAKVASGGRSLKTPKRSFGYGALARRVRGTLREFDVRGCPSPHPSPCKNGEREQTFSTPTILPELDKF
jgi:hypothetical protein